ncbi:hypothetical protein G8759_27565 [Spirosoma aureum]|uniref:Uncharacterized protein n=1 Tax=Spirosoma aureum TaxID=2692134 RepID=A0A6G9AV12_9BACT|nr:hypothetical protein [Spirosoma aureum]QIP16125.1 hypothetical protein G8759_27565 [Spirosoma aureum]
MNYKAITTLKKADTEGRVPEHTLDQYIRSELSQQLIKALTPHLPINRNDHMQVPSENTVDFSTELIFLQPHQWEQLKQSLNGSLDSLLPEQQFAIRQLIDEVEKE